MNAILAANGWFTTAAPVDLSHWWKRWGDSQLDALIEGAQG